MAYAQIDLTARFCTDLAMEDLIRRTVFPTIPAVDNEYQYGILASAPAGNTWVLTPVFAAVTQVVIYNMTIGQTCTVHFHSAAGVAATQILPGGRCLVLSDVAIATGLVLTDAPGTCDCMMVVTGS